MKIFISHSTLDKWAARKISEDLERLGLTTFLDEKDIRTGESIDAAIAAHLEESDHFLILLSPASVASHWVLVELGGAIALKKQLVPVLLYLGSNEIPAPIQRFLARDINDLQKYYEELLHQAKKRTPGKAAKATKQPSRRAHPKRPALLKLKVHDRVRLPVVRPKLESADEKRFGWTEGADNMDAFLGKEATVTSIEQHDGFSIYRIDIDDGKFAWYRGWLDAVVSPA